MEMPFLWFAFIHVALGAFIIAGYAMRYQVPWALFWWITAMLLVFVVYMPLDTIQMEYFLASNMPIMHYDVQSSTGQALINSVTAHSRGERLSNTSSVLEGDTIDCMTVWIGRSGSPPLTTLITVGVMDTSTNMVKQFGSMNVTQLLTSSVFPYEFCLPLGDTYTFTDTETWGIKYNGGDGSNTLTTRVDANNPFDGVNTQHVHATASSWISNAGEDIMGILTLRAGNTTSVDYDISFTGPNYLMKVMLIFMAAIVGVMGAMMELRSRR